MEVISGIMMIIFGVLLLFYFAVSCRVIVKGSESAYFSPEKEKKS
jgi:hypothetical protein